MSPMALDKGQVDFELWLGNAPSKYGSLSMMGSALVQDEILIPHFEFEKKPNK